MAGIRWQATNLMLDAKHKNALGEASSAFVDEARMERARQSVIRCIKCARGATPSFIPGINWFWPLTSLIQIIMCFNRSKDWFMAGIRWQATSLMVYSKHKTP